MKAINSSVRGATVYFDLVHASDFGQRSAEKRFNRKTERARLKMSLIGEIHGAPAEEVRHKARVKARAAVLAKQSLQNMLNMAFAQLPAKDINYTYLPDTHCKPRRRKQLVCGEGVDRKVLASVG